MHTLTVHAYLDSVCAMLPIVAPSCCSLQVMLVARLLLADQGLDRARVVLAGQGSGTKPQGAAVPQSMTPQHLLGGSQLGTPPRRLVSAGAAATAAAALACVAARRAAAGRGRGSRQAPSRGCSRSMERACRVQANCRSSSRSGGWAAAKVCRPTRMQLRPCLRGCWMCGLVAVLMPGLVGVAVLLLLLLLLAVVQQVQQTRRVLYRPGRLGP